jgi:acyl-CoA thioester hydrolase
MPSVPGTLPWPMAKWIETFKGAVLTSEYDPEAHMNTQIYVSRFDQASWFLLAAIDVTPRSIKKQNRRIAVVRQSFQFLRELRGGELITIQSGFIAVGEKYLRFVHRMWDSETGKMVATSDCTAVEASLKTQKSVPLSAPIRAAAKKLLVTWNDAERKKR